jgi:hypothetical protein
LIAIFVLLGLGFLGAGAAAIVDGLPYLVLERGFTQVIIGTVGATAGVILLALAWVLVEVRRVKATLANAAMAMSVASMAAAPEPQDAAVTAHDLLPTRDVPPVAGVETHGRSLGMAGAAIGAAAGAGGVLAATHAFETSARTDAANDEVAPAEPAAVRDLFVDHPAEHDEVEHTEPEAASPTESSPILPAAEDYAFPALDPFRSLDAPVLSGAPRTESVPTSEHTPNSESAAETSSEPETSNVPETWSAAEISSAPRAWPETPDVEKPATELASDEAEAIAETQEVDDSADETAEDHVPADEDSAEDETSEHTGPIEWPYREATHVPEPEPKPVDAGRGTDEFSFLRESLSGRQQERDQSGQRIEPSLRHGDETDSTAADAESWMHPASRRKDPWFGDATVANDPDPSEPRLEAPKLDVTGFDERSSAEPSIVVPHWPPQTREASASDRDIEEKDHSEVDDTATAHSEHAHAALPEHDEATATAAPEPHASTEAPAASNEGVVGAYQVGDAHFTIYADGSIQARTPDGNYSFASMDELKVYLASEKSRLGG